MTPLERAFLQAERLHKAGLRVEAELVRHVDATPETVRAIEALVDVLEPLWPAGALAASLLSNAEAGADYPEGAALIAEARQMFDAIYEAE